jgi:putative NADH-flavin reductase
VNFVGMIGAFLSTRMGIIFATYFVDSKVTLPVTCTARRSTKRGTQQGGARQIRRLKVNDGKMVMKIAIFGATGKTGRHLVGQALHAGHEVIALVRRFNFLASHKRLTEIQVALEDVPAMTRALAGCDAVVSCLGIPPTFASMTREVNFQRQVLPRILAAIRDAQVGHFILMSAFGVGDTATKASWVAQKFVYQTMARKLFEDKALSECELMRTDVNWTIAYPVMLKEAPPEASAAVIPLDQVEKVPGIPALPYANVASALLALAETPASSGRRLLICAEGSWQPKQ